MSTNERSCRVRDERGLASDQGSLTNNAERGNVDCVRYLLAKGSSPNEGSDRGYTPLLAASQFGHLEVARLLITAGADVNFHTANGTALCRALQNQRAAIELVDLLFQSGATLSWDARISALNCLGDYHGRKQKFEYLINHGVLDRLTQRQKDAALADLSWEEIRLLVLNGADPNAIGDRGQTILIRAVMNHQCDMVKFLLAHGARVNIRDSDGHTALDWALLAQDSLKQVADESSPPAQLNNARNKAIIQMLQLPSSAMAVGCEEPHI